ncbi:MAG: type IV toxin-antitoxin system AbiEi family antitoxin [Verrucomicrobia bacterium]|nr:type IV toxin-antitoxin system AbiEi family antitoxin [Verrucomicrobiota bacterium]
MKQESLADFVDALQSSGRYTFTRDAVGQNLKVTNVALTFALNRLSRRGRIVAVRRGFYVIVPLEYASGKILPADWFIANLMKFLEQPYYVGLLSAAALHGAAHQQPQVFHVVTTKAQRRIEVHGLAIRFFTKAGMERIPIKDVKTSTGYIRVSTPGATAIDLVAYQSRVGGWDRIATILQELVEVMDEDGLLEAAKLEKELQVVQRLGWVLCKLGYDAWTHKLSEWLSHQRIQATPIDPALPRKGFPRDSRWNVIVNTEVEGEL